MNDQDQQLMDELNSIMQGYVNHIEDMLRAKQTQIDTLNARIAKLERPKKIIASDKSSKDTSKTAGHTKSPAVSQDTTPTHSGTRPSDPKDSLSEQQYGGILGDIQSSNGYESINNTKKSNLLANVCKYPNAQHTEVEYIHIWLVVLLAHLREGKDDNKLKIKIKENFTELLLEFSVIKDCTPEYLDKFIEWIDQENKSKSNFTTLTQNIYTQTDSIPSLIKTIKPTMLSSPQNPPS